MTRIETIFNSARFILADKQAQRFSDSDLIDLLNRGLIDFCQRTNMLHEVRLVQAVAGSAYFQLPADLYKLTRITYNNIPLRLVTHSELDNHSNTYIDQDFYSNFSTNWESKTGYPEAFIWDRRNVLQGKLYPIPPVRIIKTTLSSVFGVVTGSASTFTTQPNFGTITSHVDSYFGVISLGASLEDLYDFNIYYIKNHDVIVDKDTTLEIPNMYDTALIYYITGQAFLANLDNQYIQKAQNQIALYEQIVMRALVDSSKSWTRASQFKTSYRRGV